MLTRQPNYPAKLVRSGLTAGLVFAGYPIDGIFVDMVTGVAATQADTSNPTTQAVAWTNDGASRYGEVCQVVQCANVDTSGQKFPLQATGVDYLTTIGTLLVLAGVTAGTAANKYHLVFGSAEFVNFGRTAMIGIDDNGFSGVGRVMTAIANSDTQTSFSTVNNVLTSDPKGKLAFFGNSWHADIGQNYIYTSGLGIAREQFVTTIQTSLDPARQTWIGRAAHNTSQNGYANQVALAFAWNRVLKVNEYMALWQNPWRLFKPMQRRVYSVASAAAVTSRYYYDLLAA